MKLDGLRRFFSLSTEKEVAFKLYATVMEQSRQPALFLKGGIADTLDGRFDSLILHAFLLLRRLKETGPNKNKLSQAFFDVMFQNMDESLREVGVGDLSVGSKIKNMAEAFYGRAAAYEEGLTQEDDDKLQEALLRNLYRGEDVSPDALALISTYIRKQVSFLNTQDLGKITKGELQFKGLDE